MIKNEDERAPNVDLNVDLSYSRQMAWRALLQGHAALTERVERAVTSAGGVSLDWYDVMLALSKAPNGRLRMGELACHVVLSRSGLTRLVDRMEAEGFVARELAAGDRRSFEAFLTDKGVAAFERTWPIYARAVAQVWVPLSEAEVRQLASLLDRVREAVGAGCSGG